MAISKWIATLFVSALTFAGSSYASVVTQCGPNVCYEYDDAQSGQAMFGLPTIAGDSLIFLSPMFRAESLNGAGEDIAQATFVVDRVYSLNHGNIMDIVIFESGDYRTINDSAVSAELQLDVANNNSAETGSTSDIFSATGDSGGQQQWDLLGTFDPHSEFSGSANDVMVSITDILIADADTPTESAFIQKKLTLTAASVVPVPAAVWLFGSALGALGWIRRKR